jgi:hypothetical protein
MDVLEKLRSVLFETNTSAFSAQTMPALSNLTCIKLRNLYRKIHHFWASLHQKSDCTHSLRQEI